MNTLKSRDKFKIWTSGALSLVFFLGNSLWAYSSETRFWEARKKSIEVARLPVEFPQSIRSDFPVHLPLNGGMPKSKNRNKWVSEGTHETPRKILSLLSDQFSSIRKVHLPPQAKRFVVYVQDIHLNSEAQRNIGKTIQELTEQGNIDFIGLEAAFEPISLDAWTGFKRQDVVKKVADYLFRVNKITGPIHYALTGPRPAPPIIGVDDPNHYFQNVESYRRASSQQPGYRKKIEKINQALEQQKRRVFNPQLLAFDRQVQASQLNQISIGDHVRNLAAYGRPLTPDVQLFLKGLDLETSIDLETVVRERAVLLTNLLEKLDKKNAASIFDETLNFRLKKVSHVDFYKYLSDLCLEHGVDMGNFPSMKSYLEYLLISDSISVEKLIEDRTRLESEVYRELTRTPLEEGLVKKSQSVFLVKKLVDFSLSPEEWTQYQKTPIADFPKELPDMKAFESFYLEAGIRDQAISMNLLNEMDRTHADVALLVTGGFHSKGIESILSRQKVGIITLAPRITCIQTNKGEAREQSYLSVFNQEKTPLDELFEGKKLFLGIEAANALGRQGAGIASALMPNEASGTFQRFSSRKDFYALEASSKKNPNSVFISHSKSRSRIRMTVKQTENFIHRVIEVMERKAASKSLLELGGGALILGGLFQPIVAHKSFNLILGAVYSIDSSFLLGLGGVIILAAVFLSFGFFRNGNSRKTSLWSPPKNRGPHIVPEEKILENPWVPSLPSFRPLESVLEPNPELQVSVVCPVFDEFSKGTFIRFLLSFARQNADASLFELIFVVQNTPEQLKAQSDEYEDNQKTIELIYWLRGWKQNLDPRPPDFFRKLNSLEKQAVWEIAEKKLNIQVIDLSSSGFEVHMGRIRNIGVFPATQRAKKLNRDIFIANMDADALVPKDYISTLVYFINKPTVKAIMTGVVDRYMGGDEDLFSTTINKAIENLIKRLGPLFSERPKRMYWTPQLVVRAGRFFELKGFPDIETKEPDVLGHLLEERGGVLKLPQLRVDVEDRQNQTRRRFFAGFRFFQLRDNKIPPDGMDHALGRVRLFRFSLFSGAIQRFFKGELAGKIQDSATIFSYFGFPFDKNKWRGNENLFLGWGGIQDKELLDYFDGVGFGQTNIELRPSDGSPVAMGKENVEDFSRNLLARDFENANRILNEILEIRMSEESENIRIFQKRMRDFLHRVWSSSSFVKIKDWYKRQPVERLPDCVFCLLTREDWFWDILARLQTQTAEAAYETLAERFPMWLGPFDDMKTRHDLVFLKVFEIFINLAWSDKKLFPVFHDILNGILGKVYLTDIEAGIIRQEMELVSTYQKFLVEREKKVNRVRSAKDKKEKEPIPLKVQIFQVSPLSIQEALKPMVPILARYRARMETARRWARGYKTYGKDPTLFERFNKTLRDCFDILKPLRDLFPEFALKSEVLQRVNEIFLDFLEVNKFSSMTDDELN